MERFRGVPKEVTFRRSLQVNLHAYREMTAREHLGYGPSIRNNSHGRGISKHAINPRTPLLQHPSRVVREVIGKGPSAPKWVRREVIKSENTVVPLARINDLSKHLRIVRARFISPRTMTGAAPWDNAARKAALRISSAEDVAAGDCLARVGRYRLWTDKLDLLGRGMATACHLVDSIRVSQKSSLVP